MNSFLQMAPSVLSMGHMGAEVLIDLKQCKLVGGE